MANIIRPIVAKIRSFFGSKPSPPKAPKRITVTGGQRGVAAGDLRMRHRKIREGQEPYEPKEIEKWGNVPEGEATDFVYGGFPLFVNSSNVASATYHHESNEMDVEFLDGSMYRYSSVTPQEALEFVQYQSKGDFIWTKFRIRGTKNGHRRPFQKIH